MFIPAEFKEIEDGVFTRERKGSLSTEGHYRNSAVKILNDDLRHYTKMQKSFKTSELFRTHYPLIKDVGGGHPKLASLLKSDRIIVIDPLADFYSEMNSEFDKVYSPEARVEYYPEEIDIDADLTIFCHILEHLPIDEVREKIKSTKSDICIYGPNIQRASSKGWFHFRPADHITFITLDKMEQILENLDFTIKMSYEFNEDYILHAKRKL